MSLLELLMWMIFGLILAKILTTYFLRLCGYPYEPTVVKLYRMYQEQELKLIGRK